MGRPSKHIVIENNLDKIKELAQNGYTDLEISQYIGISKTLFYDYKKKHSEFSELLSTAKDKADNSVINSLFKRAMGYEFTEEHAEYITDDTGKKIQGIKSLKKIKKQVAPDVTAQIFWLKNRKYKDWMDRKESIITENSIPEFDEMSDEELIKYIESEKNKAK